MSSSSSSTSCFPSHARFTETYPLNLQILKLQKEHEIALRFLYRSPNARDVYWVLASFNHDDKFYRPRERIASDCLVPLALALKPEGELVKSMHDGFIDFSERPTCFKGRYLGSVHQYPQIGSYWEDKIQLLREGNPLHLLFEESDRYGLLNWFDGLQKLIEDLEKNGFRLDAEDNVNEDKVKEEIEKLRRLLVHAREAVVTSDKSDKTETEANAKTKTDEYYYSILFEKNCQ